ncbi:hypothetical protein EES46_18020 [Streptomyces sp. ADI98-10]|nr:hypothetical protein EES46_18020 [Streptomyces sp. ADI98-10]
MLAPPHFTLDDVAGARGAVGRGTAQGKVVIDVG